MTYNVRRGVGERNGIPCDADSEFDDPKTIELIAGALRRCSGVR